jgi:hypothetical protein
MEGGGGESLAFADDLVIVAKSEKEMENMVRSLGK